MGTRQELHEVLKGLFAEGEDPHVYHQPPPDEKMSYPCIVYNRDDVRTSYADNVPYKSMTRYQVTIIDRDSDSVLPARLAKLPLCSFERFFTLDNLNHDVYNLYF